VLINLKKLILLALTIVYFITVVSDVSIYTYTVTQRDGFRKVDIILPAALWSRGQLAL